MNTLVWHLHQWGRRLGRTGLAGLGLLLVAALIVFVNIIPTKAKTLVLETRVAALQRASIRVPQRVVVMPNSGFIDSLPETHAASAVIGQLERVARAHGLQLLRGQYTQAPVTGTTLLRWQLSLPIKAEYPNIIAFVAASMQALPTLALEEIKLKRDKIETAVLDADLRFNLYLRVSIP